MHKFVVGVRASFGSSTLKEEDRKGATMDTPRFSFAFVKRYSSSAAKHRKPAAARVDSVVVKPNALPIAMG